MTDVSVLILFGIGAVVFVSGVLFGYTVYKKKRALSPKKRVMHKIQDFYSAQDQENKQNINY